jgi:3-isopropylmalate dehydratase
MSYNQSSPATLYDKIWATHLICRERESCLIYVDGHIVYEITSPQAFDGLRSAKRPLRRPDLTLSTVDHNIPTTSRKKFTSPAAYIGDPQSKLQVATLEQNVRHYGLTYYGLDDQRQGIVHVVGPEQGFTLPGTVFACGDSHTGTVGAFGNLALGIGTSEVEHILATQTIRLSKFKNMRIWVEGDLKEGVVSKDLMLHIVGKIGFAGATGHVVEYAGPTIQKMSMESRMTICNMSIEAGARAGLIAPDNITVNYLKGRRFAPKKYWDRAVEAWQELRSDEGAAFDKEVFIDAGEVSPTVTWGTTPADIISFDGLVPDPADFQHDLQEQKRIQRALDYMDLKPRMKPTDIKVDKIFIGSCTNSRIEDLRSAAAILRDRIISTEVQGIVVPGSGLVKKQAEEEGLDIVFIKAGLEWREAGCSMCPGINPDRLTIGERCASTSNRNFEGRQGPGGRTHLMSPATAAATAIRGYISDPRDYPPIAHARGQLAVEPSPSLEPTQQTQRQINDPAEASSSESVEPYTAIVSGTTEFHTLRGVAAPIHLSNVDTDMIIPGKYLAVVKKDGLGKALFTTIRYKVGTSEPISTFILNQSPWTQAKFLIVTGENFGCGSSREHAAWALKDFGIRVVLAPSFAGIFLNNAFKNGVLCVVFPKGLLLELANHAEMKPGSELELRLEEQILVRPTGEQIPFEIDNFKKYCLLNGLDEISLALQHEEEIEHYEKWRAKTFPWLEEEACKPAIRGIKRSQDWNDW